MSKWKVKSIRKCSVCPWASILPHIQKHQSAKGDWSRPRWMDFPEQCGVGHCENQSLIKPRHIISVLTPENRTQKSHSWHRLKNWSQNQTHRHVELNWTSLCSIQKLRRSSLQRELYQLENDILMTLIRGYFTPAQIREQAVLHRNEIRDHISHWYMTHYEI